MLILIEQLPVLGMTLQVNDDCSPPATQTAASLPAPAAGQGVGTHSYLWRQVLLTEPIGQWLCVGGRHGYAWSIKRSDKASMDRVQRRRA